MPEALFREQAINRATQPHLGEPGLNALRPLLIICCLILGAVAVLSALVASSEFSRKHTVQGRVDEATTNTLVARGFGYLAELHVREGDTVAAGEHLGRIITRRQARGVIREQQRQLTLLDDITARTSASLEETRRATDSRDQQLVRQMKLARADIRLQARKIRELEAQLSRIRKLNQQGYLSSLEYLRFKQTVTNEQQGLNKLRQALTRLFEQRLALRQMLREREQATRQKLAELDLRRSEIAQARSLAAGQTQQDIIATTHGQVARIEVLRGGWLVPGQPILHIASQGHPLTGSVYLPSQALGQVTKGKRLRLSFDAYPVDQFGKVDATVTGVTSPRANTEKNLFVARLNIDAPHRELRISPGMTFTAHVVTERRTLLGWLIRPLTRLRENFSA